MKKSVTLLMAMAAISAASIQAADFEVLTTPDEILKNSVEDEAGAKAALEAALANEDPADDEEAAQTYMKVSTPKPGYAYDMSFLMPYSDLSKESDDVQFNRTNLAKYWKSDIPGIVLGDGSDFTKSTDGTSLRLYNSSLLQATESLGKLALYQNVELNKGAYQLASYAWVVGQGSGAMLVAGEKDGSGIQGKASAKEYTLDFTVAANQTMPLGFKRADKAGALTQIVFTYVRLYKVSNIVEINDDATGPLAAAEGVDVQLNRSFEADKYYPICLPFIVENWREIFDDLVAYNSLVEENGVYGLNFNTVAGANSIARKPYLVKFNKNIDESNYLIFKNVTITKGNPGTWADTKGQMVFEGNWAAETLPAGNYFLNADGEWIKSDGTTPLTAFSAYMKLAESYSTEVDKFALSINNAGVSTIVEGPVVNEGPVVVYNMQGMVVRRNADAADPLAELPNGIYVVNGKKYVK